MADLYLLRRKCSGEVTRESAEPLTEDPMFQIIKTTRLAREHHQEIILTTVMGRPILSKCLGGLLKENFLKDNQLKRLLVVNLILTLTLLAQMFVLLLDQTMVRMTTMSNYYVKQ